MKAIVTVPPYAPFLEEVGRHPVVDAVRLNVVMPTKSADSIEDVLARVHDRTGKPLWIDLKARQLRVEGYGVPPFTEVCLSHRIQVETPVTAYFCDGAESATVLEVDGNRLLMMDGPKRVVGPGESVNIPHHSLRVEGFLTDTDRRYVEAAERLGIKDYMLSFVESRADVACFREIVPDANLVAKVESQRGLHYVREDYDGTRLMAARGDLFVEVDRPHLVLKACEDVVRASPGAIVASRILPSLAHTAEPCCADLNDLDNLHRMGYRTVMLGDDVCQRRESVMSALNVLYALNQDLYLEREGEGV